MKLLPYVKLKGNAEEAINYYKGLLGGEIIFLQRYGEGPKGMEGIEGKEDKIMHATLSANGVTINIADSIDENWKGGEGSVSLSLNLEPGEDMDSIYEGLIKGGMALMPIQDTFWNARFAAVVDKFGISWMINQEKK